MFMTFTNIFLTLIPKWINNYIHYKVWDEITYPLPNFNGCTVELFLMDEQFQLILLVVRGLFWASVRW